MLGLTIPCGRTILYAKQYGSLRLINGPLSVIFVNIWRGMNQVFRAFVCMTLVCVASTAQGVLLGAESLTITKHYTYADYGNGDTTFQFTPANAISGCDGAWIAPSQPGAKQLLAIMLSAKLAQKTITLWLDNSVIWGGSSARFCKVHALGIS